MPRLDQPPDQSLFATEQSDNEWLERLRSSRPYLWRDAKRIELRRRLLAYGGFEVAHVEREGHIAHLLSARALVWDGGAAKRLVSGQRVKLSPELRALLRALVAALVDRDGLRAQRRWLMAPA